MTWLTYNLVVVDQLAPERADAVFAALSDRTRRDIVTRVLRSEASVSSLASHYAMSFAAVQKHVAVLERASLVTKRRHGREQLVSGHVETIRAVQALLDQLEEIWRGRLDRIGDLLGTDTRGVDA